jgi:hypothetical protein
MSPRTMLRSSATLALLAVGLAGVQAGCSSSSGDSTGSGGSTGQGSGGTSGSGGSAGPGSGGVPGTGGVAGTGGAGGSATGTGGSTPGTGGTVVPDGGGSGGAPDSGASDVPGMMGACGACPANVLGHCDSAANYPTYPGYALQMVEDFCAPLDLDHDPIWTWSDGAPADGATWFRKEQLTFAGGKMTITANRMAQPAGFTSYSESDYNSMTGKPIGRTVVSGEFRTKYNNYRYGRYEVRYRSPKANADVTMGGYLATMFAFRTPKWRTWNEVDIELEPFDESPGVGSIVRKIAGNVVYFKNNGAGVPGYPGGAAFVADPPAGVANYIQTDVHTYAFEWTATKVTWYVDGIVAHTYTGTAPKIPDLSAKIMMNLWVFGGTHFGDPAANTYPLQSEYEWFRFYKQTGETYPCTSTPGCLQAADTEFAKNNVSETTYP